MCSSLEGVVGRTGADVVGKGGASDSGGGGGVRGLVDRTPCQVWTMCPLRFLLVSGKYFSAWVYVIPGHDT